MVLMLMRQAGYHVSSNHSARWVKKKRKEKKKTRKNGHSVYAPALGCHGLGPFSPLKGSIPENMAPLSHEEHFYSEIGFTEDDNNPGSEKGLLVLSHQCQGC